jgi:hypothetical protein
MKGWYPGDWTGLFVFTAAACALGEDAVICVNARQPGRPVSRHLTPASVDQTEARNIPAR